LQDIDEGEKKEPNLLKVKIRIFDPDRGVDGN
jgi:hypothetical protein